MTELKASLNRIWRAKAVEGFVGAIKKQLLTYSAVLAVGFLLLVSLVVSASISAAAMWVGGIWTVPAVALQAINLGVSIVIITVLFAMLYRVLPDADVEWKDVWVGSLFTTGLFVIGKQALGIYLGRTASTSAYGAAGSVLILLAWVYYSAQIFYLGAEFTRVYSELFGSRSGDGPAGQFSGR
jgi:membrane protein